MGLMDKFKNLFTEEVEEVKPIKKEVRHVEIKAPKKEPEEMPKKEENTISDSTTIKKEEKFVFPVYFDDKDFDDLEKPKEKKIEKKKEKPTKGAYNGSLKREMNVEEKKSFKPSLIISPVYGVLDKNYHKEDITSKKVVTHSNYYKKSEDLTIDDIRDKAYGTLEDELKNNILGNEEIINEKRENTETAIDLFNELDFDEIDKKEQENNSENNGNNNNSLLFDDSSYDDDNKDNLPFISSYFFCASVTFLSNSAFALSVYLSASFCAFETMSSASFFARLTILAASAFAAFFVSSEVFSANTSAF